jgi:hypothetical protein
MSTILSVEERIKVKAEAQWLAEFEAIIGPFRSQVPDCFVEIGGKNIKAKDVFEHLTAAIFLNELPKKQEEAVVKFLDIVEKHKLEDEEVKK